MKIHDIHHPLHALADIAYRIEDIVKAKRLVLFFQNARIAVNEKIFSTEKFKCLENDLRPDACCVSKSECNHEKLLIVFSSLSPFVFLGYIFTYILNILLY